ARRKALVAARQSSEKLLHSSAFRRTTSRIRRRACTPHRRRGFSAPHRLSPWVWTHSAPSRDHSTHPAGECGSARPATIHNVYPSSLEPGQRLLCLAGYPERQVQSIAYHNVEAGSVWQVGYVIPEAVVLQDPQGLVAIAVATEDLALWALD